jgi:hypothetical protein
VQVLALNSENQKPFTRIYTDQTDKGGSNLYYGFDLSDFIRNIRPIRVQVLALNSENQKPFTRI